MDKFGLKFKLFGFPILVDITYLFLFGFIFFQFRELGPAIEVTLWIFISVLIHELGHAFAGRYFGLDSKIRMLFLVHFGERG